MLVYIVWLDPDSTQLADQMQAYGPGRIADWQFNHADIVALPTLRTDTISRR